MKYKIKAYSIQELGQRDNQEDSLFPEHGKLGDGDRLFVLCDGMGGHSGGEIASGTVVRAFGESVLRNVPDAEGPFSDDAFRTALKDAYDALDLKDDGAERKMGTTFTCLKLHEGGCTIGHIGDSRVYHIRPGKTADDTEILFQTRDHSLVNDLVRIGELTPEEAKMSKQKNVITRAMQPKMERRSKADLYHSADIRPGDYFMLCSDGILENFEDENIKFIFSDKGGDAAHKVEMIVGATEHNRDNHTAIIVHVLDVIGEAVGEEPQELAGPSVEASEKQEEGLLEKPVAPHISSDPSPVPEPAPRKGSSKAVYYVVAALILLLGGYALQKCVFRDDGKEEETEMKQESGEVRRKEDARQDARQETPVEQEIPVGQETTDRTDVPEQENPADAASAVQSVSALPQVRDGSIPNSDQQNVMDAIINKR